MTQKLDAMLAEAIGTSAPMLPNAPQTVALAQLRPGEHGGAVLSLWPADTLTQARHFYRKSDPYGRLQRLMDRGWHVTANYHHGFTRTGLCWVTATLALAKYVGHWQKNISNARQVPRPLFNIHWQRLVDTQMALASERPKFDRDFVNTARMHATPRPGLWCGYSWPVAQELHAGEIRRRINDLLAALDEGMLA